MVGLACRVVEIDGRVGRIKACLGASFLDNVLGDALHSNQSLLDIVLWHTSADDLGNVIRC